MVGLDGMDTFDVKHLNFKPCKLCVTFVKD